MKKLVLAIIVTALSSPVVATAATSNGFATDTNHEFATGTVSIETDGRGSAGDFAEDEVITGGIDADNAEVGGGGNVYEAGGNG